jgi:hypothetical protein
MLLRITPVPMQRWIFSLAKVLAFAGVVLVAIGTAVPAYKDPKAAQLIFSGAECEVGVPNRNENLHCDSVVWQRSMESLRTSKWLIVDVGMGFLASALSFALFGAYCRRAGIKSWTDLRTPKSSATIVVLAGISWFAQIPAYLILIVVELAFRDCCPWWADSVAIPIFEIPRLVGALFFPYMAIWLFIWGVFLFKSRLPASILLTVPGSPMSDILWTTAALLL